jgi:hypothetical protein
MKVRFYCDIWPGLDPARCAMHANTQPMHEKAQGSKRLAFDVVIPDTLLFSIDAYAPEANVSVVGE